MDQSSGRRRAFTLVEVVVVIAIMATLIGVLLPALSGVMRRSAKAGELNNLRRVGLAWTMYANQNDDRLLPGYLRSQVQEAWHVTYRFPDGSPVPPGPDYEPDPEGRRNVAGPWPWRLLSYLDYDPEVVLGHREGSSLGIQDLQARAWEVRENPTFAYNGLFFGGWWEGPQTFQFEQARVHQTTRRVNVVARSLGSIRRSSEVVVFGSAAERRPGVYRYHSGRDDQDGTFIIHPPIFTSHQLWGLPDIREEALSEGGRELVAQLGGEAQSVELYGNDDWFDNPVPYG